MADEAPLLMKNADGDGEPKSERKNARLASLDVFRGLSVSLMIFVDYAGPLLPLVAHSPWNGVHLADFVMPFFLFIVGVSLPLVYKNVKNRMQATCKALLRAVELFILGILVQGGYLHGVTSLTFGVDIETIRWFGILQVVTPWWQVLIRPGIEARVQVMGISLPKQMERISIGYIVAALCEIWLPCRTQREAVIFKSYYLHWCFAFALSAIYLGLLYGLYIPDWQFRASDSTLSASSSNDGQIVYTVKCAVRGDLGPACNSAGMIDRCILGVGHLYKKPVYRNLKECNGQASEDLPSWCLAPFDPEGILSSLTAAITSIIGLHYGHVLVLFEGHKDRVFHWLLFSLPVFGLGLILNYLGIPMNKSLYTISYMLLTSASAGITFCFLYIMVDICGYRCLTYVFEWMGMHSLGIFILVSSNLAVIVVQGFYWISPENNIIHWIISLVRK